MAAAPDVIFGVEKKWVKLGVSLVVDGIGVSSFLLPVLGEATDAGVRALVTGMLAVACLRLTHPLSISPLAVGSGERCAGASALRCALRIRGIQGGEAVRHCAVCCPTQLADFVAGSKLLTFIDFCEEALPFSDALPTACIGWTLEYSPLGALVGFAPKSDAKK